MNQLIAILDFIILNIKLRSDLDPNFIAANSILKNTNQELVSVRRFSILKVSNNADLTPGIEHVYWVSKVEKAIVITVIPLKLLKQKLLPRATMPGMPEGMPLIRKSVLQTQVLTY